jgi:hypothetical protein
MATLKVCASESNPGSEGVVDAMETMVERFLMDNVGFNVTEGIRNPESVIANGMAGHQAAMHFHNFYSCT